MRNSKIEIISKVEISDFERYVSNTYLNTTFTNESVRSYSNICLSMIPIDWQGIYRSILKEIELLPDIELVNNIKNLYDIKSEPVEKIEFLDNYIFSKINHGFWEHIAFLHTDDINRLSYRDVNLQLREKRYLKNNFLPMLLASWYKGQNSDQYIQFISINTGALSFSQAVGNPWSETNINNMENYKISFFKRGALKGLISCAKLFNVIFDNKKKFNVVDSFWVNSNFQSRIFFSSLLKNFSENSMCLFVGPKTISGIRLKYWPGDQYFLCISSQEAMLQWELNLHNIDVIIDSLKEKYEKILILFQGAVLGPVIASYLSNFPKNIRNRITFIDLGRLLDLEYGYDLTKTGSPLPSGGFSSYDQFEKTIPSGFVFSRKS